MINNPPFNFKKTKLNNKGTLYTVNIENYNKEFSNFMDEKIVSICLPDNTKYDLSTIKKKILKFLNSKNEQSDGKANTIVVGYICEFIIHLFFSHLGFKQEFQFLNLEDGGAMKKGFDGVYSNKKIDWYLESKSGGCDYDHKDKIKLGYKDLIEKFSGKAQNNPWFNALNHTKIVKSKKSLVDKIESLSYNFDNEIFVKIDDFNIIPCSTIIFENQWKELNINEIKIMVNNLISGFNYSSIIVVCINKKSLTHFKAYLKS